jgi:hypothetical protein
MGVTESSESGEEHVDLKRVIWGDEDGLEVLAV